MKTPASRRVSLAARALLSALFVLVVLRAVDLKEVLASFSDLSWGQAGLLLVISAVGITASCLKWRILLRAGGYRVGLGYLSALYLLGYFFNNFMPSMVGGDVARGHYLGRRIGSLRDGYLSVFMERTTGLLALLILVAVVALIDHPVVHAPVLRIPLALFAVLCPLVLALAFSRRLFALALRLAPRGVRPRLESLHDSFTAFGRNPLVFAEALMLSLVFHVTTGVNVLVACHALRFDADPLQVILVTPLIIVVSLVPVTINGLGLWEGGFVFFLSFAGVTDSVALSAALLLRVKNLLVSALGAAVFWSEGRGARAGLAQAPRKGDPGA